MWETWVQSLGGEDPLEEGMATHSSILAWRIPWTEEPGGLQSTGMQGAGDDRVSTSQLSLYLVSLLRTSETKQDGKAGDRPLVDLMSSSYTCSGAFNRLLVRVAPRTQLPAASSAPLRVRRSHADVARGVSASEKARAGLCYHLEPAQRVRGVTETQETPEMMVTSSLFPELSLHPARFHSPLSPPQLTPG